MHPPAGYRVVLLTLGDDAPARALADAVRDWAGAEEVSLRTVTAAHRDPVAGIVAAIRMRPDLTGVVVRLR